MTSKIALLVLTVCLSACSKQAERPKSRGKLAETSSPLPNWERSPSHVVAEFASSCENLGMVSQLIIDRPAAEYLCKEIRKTGTFKGLEILNSTTNGEHAYVDVKIKIKDSEPKKMAVHLVKMRGQWLVSP